MANRACIIGAIEALCELVRLEKQRQVLKQEIDQANSLFLEAVKNRDDTIEFLKEMASMRLADKISEEAERRLLVQVATFLRDQVHFSCACIDILDRE